ncbi:carbohydrate ABC transporter permease [Pseudolysinimonas sp.]|uniref:carbohydrate ABC transporter permease n=1 Tax=Pseudolysinimonas sp. TaxID=2680009 RepID=UPI003F7DFFF9
MPLGIASGGRPSAAGRRKRRLTIDRVSFMIVFLGVPVAIFLIFVIYPFVLAFYYSLTDWSGFTSDIPFIGFGNYAKLLQDDLFQHALINNILLAVVVPAVTIFLALAFASLITVAGPSHGNIRGIRASSFYRTLSFFPYCVPAIVIGIIWSFVYDPSAGLLNGVLGIFGLDDQTPWLGQVSTALPASMFVIIWSFVGFYTVLFVAAIKGVPAETYEAVRLDGAGRWRTAVSITIPLIRDNVQTAYIYLGIAALDAFVYMTALFPNAGGPANTTLVMSQLLFNEAFRKGHFGYATAMGVVLALVTLIFAGVVFGVNRLLAGTDRGDRR